MYIIGYDIADKKRLVRIHRIINQYALPIQYSVFLYTGKKERLEECIQAVLKIFNPKEDDLRIYHLDANAKKERLGRSCFMEGVWLADPELDGL